VEAVRRHALQQPQALNLARRTLRQFVQDAHGPRCLEPAELLLTETLPGKVDIKVLPKPTSLMVVRCRSRSDILDRILHRTLQQELIYG
jgi:hypothetical protein